MQLTFINQPFQGVGQRVGDHLLRLLARHADFDRFRLAVAWARRAGVQPILEAMQQFRDSGGRIEAVVGIDLKGTSIQGLRLLQQVAHTVTIFQNANRRLRPTYHPKLFVFSGPKVAEVILGSSNLTQGGLFVNYEQNLLLRLDLLDASDNGALNSILAGYDLSANAANGVAQVLTAEFLEKLIVRDLLVDEDSAAAQRSRTGDQDSDETKEVLAPLFGTVEIAPPPAVAHKPAAPRPATAALPAPVGRAAVAPALPAAPAARTGPAAVAPSMPIILSMRPYPQRGDTQIQVPQELATTFFRGIKYVESQYDRRQHPISPARTKSRSGSRSGRVVNTLKLEIPECKGKAIPLVQFQKAGGTIEYSVFDGAKDVQGKMILHALEAGLASGTTKRTRPGSTMWAEF
jgi:hypothetical protein